MKSNRKLDFFNRSAHRKLSKMYCNWWTRCQRSHTNDKNIRSIHVSTMIRILNREMFLPSIIKVAICNLIEYLFHLTLHSRHFLALSRSLNRSLVVRRPYELARKEKMNLTSMKVGPYCSKTKCIFEMHIRKWFALVCTALVCIAFEMSARQRQTAHQMSHWFALAQLMEHYSVLFDLSRVIFEKRNLSWRADQRERCP